jgi:phosphatidylserine decarboxylase
MKASWFLGAPKPGLASLPEGLQESPVVPLSFPVVPVVLRESDAPMNLRSQLRRFGSNDTVNFVLTNHVARNGLTLLMGKISRVRHPWVCRVSIAIWRMFTDLDLSDAAQTSFDSLHDCFTRALRPGARTVAGDPAVLVSPSDGIVGACGSVQDGQVLQAKGMPYTLAELLGSAGDSEHFSRGSYVTLRLTSAMYHRFHAPHDMVISRVNYISGDSWNVNPPALARVSRLFCRNERAAIHGRLARGGHAIAMVPVAAVLVASIRLHFVDVLLHLRYRGPNRIDCQAQAIKGQELGWFEHGSTIIVLAPPGFTLCDGIVTGHRVRMGQPLLRLPG